MLVNRLHSVVGQCTLPIAAQEGLLPAFYKHFSGHKRTQMSDRQGADARRDATSGQIVGFRSPGAGALDQESPGSIPGGAMIKGRSARPAALSIAPRGSWRLLALRGRSQEGQLEARH